MKTAYIVNPVAGRGKSGRIWPAVEKLLKPHSDRCVSFTVGPGHASELAESLEQQGYQKIVVVGGDGTLHEVVNGLKSGKVVVGIIPGGTGNDFCRCAGIPLDYAKAAGIVNKNKFYKLDLGSVNGRLFVNVAGVGFDARVAEEVNKNFKKVKGTAAYLTATAKLLFSYRNIPLEITLDNKIEISRSVFLLAVGNAQYYGGGMRMVPSAQPDDGFFDVCIASDISKFEAIRTLPMVFSGQHVGHEKVQIYRAKKIEIRSSCESAIHADGEIVGILPATFQILPRRLNLLVP